MDCSLVISKHIVFRRAPDEETKEQGATGAPSEDRGWFRRRDKSSSRELDRATDEKLSERSRWFRRRDKTSPRRSIDYGIRRKESDKKKYDKTMKNEEKLISKRQLSIDGRLESSSESAGFREHRSSSDQSASHGRVISPDTSGRRLSSPEIDACGVITASLKIPVPMQQNSYFKEPDIPYIEDANLMEEVRNRRRDNSATRQRTGSSDSYLGQPITGTMSFQPLCNKNGEKQSHDSVLSSSSADMFTVSPSPRNTPLSDIMFGSESRATSPPIVLSPDSGTPGLSPPPSPPPPLVPRKIHPTEHSSMRRTIQMPHLTSDSFGTKPSITSTGTREIGGARVSNIIPIARSRTEELTSLSVSHQLRTTTTNSGSNTRIITHNAPAASGTKSTPSDAAAVAAKKSTKKRSTRLRGTTMESLNKSSQELQQHQQRSADGGSSHQQPSADGGSSHQLWKRWEIIASDPAEPETFV